MTIYCLPYFGWSFSCSFVSKVLMRLQPRNYVYTKFFKTRLRKRFSTPLLTYGDIGLVLISQILLTARRLGKIKLRLKQSSRKKLITHRYFWLLSSPHLPLTRKSTNARMGKGCGKLKTWYTPVRGGVTLMEFKNLRSGRALFFFRCFRMGLRTADFSLIRQSNTLVRPLSRSTLHNVLPFH